MMSAIGDGLDRVKSNAESSVFDCNDQSALGRIRAEFIY